MKTGAASFVSGAQQTHRGPSAARALKQTDIKQNSELSLCRLGTILSLAALAMMLASCSPKTVYVPTEKHFWHTDTLTRYITATDSVTVIERVYESDTRYDSIAPILDSLNRVIGWDRYHFRSNTKMMEAECQRLMAVIDSLRNVKSDTVREKVRVPYPVERKLTRWERTKMELGGWAFGALIVAVIAVLWLIFKKRRK